MVATKEEKDLWLRNVQQKKLDQLSKAAPFNPKKISTYIPAVTTRFIPSYRTDRKKVAKELEKRMRGMSSKDTKKVLEELLTDSGEIKPSEGGGKEGGGEGGEKK